jgi:hypothetical protein
VLKRFKKREKKLVSDQDDRPKTIRMCSSALRVSYVGMNSYRLDISVNLNDCCCRDPHVGIRCGRTGRSRAHERIVNHPA